MNSIEKKGKTQDIALELALAELNTTRDKVDFEVIEEKKGLFKSVTLRVTLKPVLNQTPVSSSFLKAEPVVTPLASRKKSEKKEKPVVGEEIIAKNSTASVEVITPANEKNLDVVETSSETLEQLTAFVQGILLRMNLDCVAQSHCEEEKIVVNILGSDNNVAIGYRGEVLDNIQYLSLLYFNSFCDSKKKIVIDAENYRQKREETLSLLSMRMARKVAKSGIAHEFEPMNPYERRIIHAALQDDKFVTTRSEGIEPRRFIIIEPKERNYSGDNADAYDYSEKNDFRRNGLGKTRSFGAPKRKF